MGHLKEEEKMRIEVSKELINQAILEGTVKVVLDAIEKDEAEIKAIDIEHEMLNEHELKLSLQIVLQK